MLKYKNPSGPIFELEFPAPKSVLAVENNIFERADAALHTQSILTPSTFRPWGYDAPPSG